MSDLRVTLTSALLAAALTTAGCGDSADSADDGQWLVLTDDPILESAALGVTVTLTPDSAQVFGYNDDGSITFDVEGVVALAGSESRHVAVTEDLENVASGARQTLITEDLATGEVRWFHYDPGDNAVVIGDEYGGVFVFQNPDGTYDVVTSLFDDPVDEADYQFADDGYAAWELVQQYNEFQTTSKFSLLMAYAMAQAPALATRSIQACVYPCNYTRATAPAVCQTFKAFCDCVACHAAGAGENCDLCAPPSR